MSEKRQTSVTEKKQKKTTACPNTLFFCIPPQTYPSLLTRSVLAFARLTKACTPVMQKRDLQHKTAQLDVHKFRSFFGAFTEAKIWTSLTNLYRSFSPALFFPFVFLLLLLQHLIAFPLSLFCKEFWLANFSGKGHLINL